MLRHVCIHFEQALNIYYQLLYTLTLTQVSLTHLHSFIRTTHITLFGHYPQFSHFPLLKLEAEPAVSHRIRLILSIQIMQSWYCVGDARHKIFGNHSRCHLSSDDFSSCIFSVTTFATFVHTAFSYLQKSISTGHINIDIGAGRQQGKKTPKKKTTNTAFSSATNMHFFSGSNKTRTIGVSFHFFFPLTCHRLHYLLCVCADHFIIVFVSKNISSGHRG